MLLGLMVPSAWAGAFLLILSAFLAWLLALSWPMLRPGARWLRVAVVAVVAIAAIWRFAGNG